jgi:CRP/FNR family transcriptional regulator
VSGDIAQLRTKCSTCNLRELCAPCCGLTRFERNAAERLVFNRSRVRCGQSLFHMEDRFTSLYAVRDGFFKSVGLLEGGRDQIIGISIPGDILGMDGIGPGRHTSNAVALENSEVCAINYAGLQELAYTIPSLQRQLYKMMGREIVHKQGVMLQLGSMNAEERLAILLLDLSRRFAARGYPSAEFNLRMSREEIGSYLNLKIETVSRTFSKFQERGLIDAKQKFIRILDGVGLERVLGREPG